MKKINSADFREPTVDINEGGPVQIELHPRTGMYYHYWIVPQQSSETLDSILSSMQHAYWSSDKTALQETINKMAAIGIDMRTQLFS